jgi:hypothetical protein
MAAQYGVGATTRFSAAIQRSHELAKMIEIKLTI